LEGFAKICLDLQVQGVVWICKDLYDYEKLCKDLCEDLERFVKTCTYGFEGTCIDIVGFVRVRKDLQGFAKIFQDLQGVGKIGKDLEGFAGICIDLPGFPLDV